MIRTFKFAAWGMCSADKFVSCRHGRTYCRSVTTLRFPARFSLCGVVVRFQPAAVVADSTADALPMQTETPDQLKAFNDSAQKGHKRKVVQREAVTVLTQGTLTDACMVSDCPHATFAATIVEEAVEGASDKTMVGVCLVDTAASTLLLGQFEDSKMRSQTLKYFTGVHFLIPESGMKQNSAPRGRRCFIAAPVGWGTVHVDLPPATLNAILEGHNSSESCLCAHMVLLVAAHQALALLPQQADSSRTCLLYTSPSPRD